MIKKSLIVATSALALTMANVSTARADDASGIILGGIVGGILASTITKGKNRDIAIAGGAVLGAVVGDEMVNHKHKPQHVESERVEYYEPHRPRHDAGYQQPQNFDPCLRYHQEHNRRACRAGQVRHEMQHSYNYGYNNQRRYSHGHPWWN
jgi:hypothetical protein